MKGKVKEMKGRKDEMSKRGWKGGKGRKQKESEGGKERGGGGSRRRTEKKKRGPNHFLRENGFSWRYGKRNRGFPVPPEWGVCMCE